MNFTTDSSLPQPNTVPGGGNTFGEGPVTGREPLPRLLQSSEEAPLMLIRNEDPDDMKPRLGVISSVHIFDLSKEEDLVKYAECLNKAGTSPFYVVRFTERHWVEQTSNWKVLIEICEQVRVPQHSR